MSNYNTFTMSHTNDITTAHGASIETPATPVVVDTAKGPAVDEQPSDERPSDDTDAAVNQGLHLLEAKPTRWYSYFLTPDFWIVLAGATCYGLSNTFEEWLVSRAPMYQVLSFIGLLGIVINGITAAIFDRDAFEGATWNGDVAGYLVGYTLCLFLFYSLVPLVLRMSSAGFYNISLLTANFWGVIIGIKVFGLKVHFMYPIAFVCIILGLVTYFLSGSMLGESKKPWLGENQERGVLGIGTAKLKALKAAKKAGADPETRFA